MSFLVFLLFRENIFDFAPGRCLKNNLSDFINSFNLKIILQRLRKSCVLLASQSLKFGSEDVLLFSEHSNEILSFQSSAFRRSSKRTKTKIVTFLVFVNRTAIVHHFIKIIFSVNTLKLSNANLKTQCCPTQNV